MKYKITKEELEKFAKDLFDKAYYGYLDLKDSIIQKMMNDFLDSRSVDANHILDASAIVANTVAASNVLIFDTLTPAHHGNGYYVFNTTGTAPTMPMPMNNSLAPNLMTVPNSPFFWPIDPHIQTEEEKTARQRAEAEGYEGNLSERF